MDNEASIELAHAVIAGDAARMKFLLRNQAVDLNTKDLSHKENFFEPFAPLTLYGAALKYGHKHLLGMLRSAKDTGKVADLGEEGGKMTELGGGEDETDSVEGGWAGHSKSVVCTIL